MEQDLYKVMAQQSQTLELVLERMQLLESIIVDGLKSVLNAVNESKTTAINTSDNSSGPGIAADRQSQQEASPVLTTAPVCATTHALCAEPVNTVPASPSPVPPPPSLVVDIPYVKTNQLSADRVDSDENEAPRKITTRARARAEKLKQKAGNEAPITAGSSGDSSAISPATSSAVGASQIVGDGETIMTVPPSDANWTTVRNKRRVVVRGSLGGGREREDYKFYHFHPFHKDTTSDDMSSYLTSLVSTASFNVTKIKSRGEYSSFKIGIPKNIVNKILQSDNWPRKSFIKEWEAKPRDAPRLPSIK